MTVEYCSLVGKGLKLNTAADVAEYVAEIEALEGLTVVRLGGNTFGVEAARAIAAALKAKDQLKVIGFSDMFTGRLKDEIPLALEAFVEAFEDKKFLVDLDLSDNAFGPAGAKPLMRLLINNRNIETLRLNNNGLGIEGGRLVSEALVEAQTLNEAEGRRSSLKVVIFGRNRLESAGARHLAKAFRAHKESLQAVRMPQNSIRPEGVSGLLAALRTCSNLEHLDLQDNTFTREGSLALASAIQHWPNLRVLDIGDCLLKTFGGGAIISALTMGSTKLEELNMSFNEIKEEAAVLIVTMLVNKTSITSLQLNGNIFTNDCDAVEGIRQILSSHGKGDALDELDEMEEEDEGDQEGDDPDGHVLVPTSGPAEDDSDNDLDDLTAAVGGLSVQK
ncbi:hypothetical protein BASA50_007304 [Batrachochytrium salamandrivorans]|uniref:Ran GTPase-activating protein 1 n=1 Tax=Batrachochytrium salamandrivorans TaxID=1357716 RepID=A0ABQ8F7D1_9FUNG|nr:hypothetical protein BASA62_003928 [Batrachochytrium salamandrivorans]KAH6583921.1 hypothetical protein BASA60_001181 [Batrachochytrium salamandrivorans]KAH6593494.1 hypothetical protein BASA50_007304 [Batrachochytrium salamandrivorans]KAH6594329.1 hypothetical protein BASA61_004036 [Batrachochytrium salamandrivorans]KAH9265012.1 hypothetical protein BASA83_011436 [Batrachochytrium salamandrivorans]